VILLEEEYAAKMKKTLKSTGEAQDRLIQAMTEALGLAETALGRPLAEVLGEKLHAEIYGTE
jgi:hypothetical protein